MSANDIPNGLSIVSHLHCGKCLAECPNGTSPAEYSALDVGFTGIGLQVWCQRHKCNVVHIDFQGQRHPANTTAPKTRKPRLRSV